MTAARFRSIVLGLDGATEGTHMGHADFRVAGRVFASLDRESRTASVHLPSDEQQRVVTDAPQAFTPAAGAWGRQGWTTIALAKADEEMVGGAASIAVRHAAALAASKGTGKTRMVTKVAKGAEAAKAGKAGTATKVGKAGKAAASAPGVRAVDAYIAGAPVEVQPILQKIRSLVRRLAPKAEEVISYRMPAFRLDGMLIYYAPFKAHIGIFPPVTGDRALEADLAPYRGPKGNLRFPLDGKMPYALIGRVVKARIADQRVRAAARVRR